MSNQPVFYFSFHGQPCVVHQTEYADGNTALVAEYIEPSPHRGEILAVLTVNIPTETGLLTKPNEVFIKDYSENGPIVDQLESLGFLTPTGRDVPSGFVFIPIMQYHTPTTEERAEARVIHEGIDLSSLNEESK